MSAYQYTPLEKPERDIRLVTLLPGRFDDPINIQINNFPLVKVNSSSERHKRLTLKELQATLPLGWNAHESKEGDYVFSHLNGVTTWTHPDPDFISDLYRANDTRPVADIWFEALSYTWGSEDDPEEVQIMPTSILSMNNEDVSQSMKSVFKSFRLRTSRKPPPHNILTIRRNLATALRYLRRKRESRVLWIDSLCINQNDDEERGKQVARMTDIYALAPRVIVWLGKSSSGGREALEELAHIGSQKAAGKEATASPKTPMYKPPSVSIWSQKRPIPRRVASTPSIASSRPSRSQRRTEKFTSETAPPSPGTSLLASSTGWRTMQRLFDRPYFRRLWIWQEIVLGGSRAAIQCGTEHFPWLCVRRGIIALLEPLSSAPKDMRVRSQHVYSLAQCRAEQPFTKLMEHTVNQECTSAHDKVYAVLGLSLSRYRTKIIPNYTISTSDAYRQAFFTTVECTKGFELFSRCDLETHQIGGPSWIPDWSTNPSRKPIETGTFYTTSDRARMMIYSEDEPNQLKVMAVKCATIENVSSYIIPSEYSPQALKKLRSCLPPALDTARYVNGGSLADAYTLTLCMDAIDDRFEKKTSYPTLEHARKTFLEYFIYGNKNKEILGDDPYIRYIFEKARGRVLLSSQEGYLGLGPPNAQKDDIVCAILGCSVPVLLRKQPGSDPKALQYKVVGPVYMHDLMYSEALLGPLPSPWVPRISKITQHLPGYFNMATSKMTFEDPRLPGIGDEWALVKDVSKGHGYREWKNEKTGKVCSTDPRMQNAALKKSGIKLKYLTLV